MVQCFGKRDAPLSLSVARNVITELSGLWPGAGKATLYRMPLSKDQPGVGPRTKNEWIEQLMEEIGPENTIIRRCWWQMHCGAPSIACTQVSRS